MKIGVTLVCKLSCCAVIIRFSTPLEAVGILVIVTVTLSGHTDATFLTGIWHLVGLASRCAVDHGFHHETEAAKNLSPLEIDMRRRLFHAVYNLDRLLCHSLGRPHSIPDDFIAVPVRISQRNISSYSAELFLLHSPSPTCLIPLLPSKGFSQRSRIRTRWLP